MVKHALRESLATSVGTEIGGETERLVDREVSLDVVERSAGALLFVNDVTTTPVEHTVDTAHGSFGALNLDKVDGLHETGFGGERGGVDDTTASGDDLTASTVDGISVQGDIEDVEADGAHVLFGEHTFLGRPLEGSDARVLDFVEVLHSLGSVDEQVGTVGVGTEAPNLTGISDIPFVLLGKDTGTGLEIITGVDLARFNVGGELLGHGQSLHEDTVVLVGRLGESDDARLGRNGLTVRHDGLTNLDGDLGVVLLEILETNFKVEFTGTSDDVFTGFGGQALHARVRLGETLETFDELGKVVGVLDFDGNLHDRRHGELHDLEVVGVLVGGDGTRLEQELVNADETDGVTGGAVLNGLDGTAHHEHGTLDGLDEKVLLLAGRVVGALDTDLFHASAGNEKASESQKMSPFTI